MTDLTAPEKALYDLLTQHESLGPKQAADALGWTKDQVAQAKEGLKAKGLISTRQGGGMQVAQASAKAEPKDAAASVERQAASGPEASKPNATVASTQASALTGAKAEQVDRNETEAHKPEARKASTPAIDKYYTSVQKIRDWGGSNKETAIRTAFITLLNHYAEKKDLFLITELAVEGKHGRKVMPDGTLKNALRLDYGYWESKDEADVIDDEIEKKFKKGYPDRNILFEDSQTAVLIQEGREVMRVQFKDPDRLDAILNAFVNHKHPEARKFEEALEHFKSDLPTILETLRDRIETARKGNPAFIAAADKFWTLTKHEINPDITEADIREMMIQHILTADIFNKIFDEPDFHRQNNIAKELEALVGTLLTYSERKNLLGLLERYYEAINAAAASIKDHHEKQQFLKVLYENFYKVYNPKMADRLGVVYTPNEIVRFMIRSTDQLLHRHFGKTLSSKNVEILDPATGTGTFLTDLIDHLPKQDLDYKYKNEIHANEVAILPYYVANLNIEYTFKQKMGYYAEFPNLCFVDTLDNTGALQYSGKQEDMFGLSSENAARIKRQNSKKISVIIGNPPYNANQQSENENNKNRAYTVLDKRIKDTYIKHSTAQKTKVYDMYARFLRWASDRVDRNGIVAFVSNSSFLRARTFDGFRACVSQEFNEMWVVDMKGDARTSGVERQQQGGNVFSDQIRVGVAVYFLVRRESATGFRCNYNAVPDHATADEKKEFLRGRAIEDLDFESVQPDKTNAWLNLLDNDWEELVPLIDKDVKLGRKKEAIFSLYSLGVVTNRDEWVYSQSKDALTAKVKYLIDAYNHELATGNPAAAPIKWTRAVKADLAKGKQYAFQADHIIRALYRPFDSEYLYYDRDLNEMQYQMPSVFGRDGKATNRCIIYTDTNSTKPFMLGAGETVPDLHYVGAACGSQVLGCYRFGEDGTRHDNLTDWGLAQFTTHYGPTPTLPSGEGAPITKEAVFHYVYAVLHDPVYREKYALNLKREFPRIPFYADFWQWSKWGKQLMDLHIGYETAEPYPLELVSSEKKSEQKKKKATLLDHLAEPEPLYQREYKVKVKLKADKEAGIIELDELTLLKGIPPEAWHYKLGNRSALEWVLDQYKEKKPSDPTIAERFNTYRFADYKVKVIDLLKRVTTVSVGTMEVVRGMEKTNR